MDKAEFCCQLDNNQVPLEATAVDSRCLGSRISEPHLLQDLWLLSNENQISFLFATVKLAMHSLNS